MTDNPYLSPNTTGEVLTPRPTSLGNLALKAVGVFAIIALLVALLLPARRTVPEAARRSLCGNHLKQIVLALQNYAADYDCLPPAYTVDPSGKPLHSWRTLLLPYLEQKQLFDQIDLSKPWDDPANSVAYDRPLKFYICPSSTVSQEQTTYFAVTANGGCFLPTEPRKLSDITDSKDLTLMVVEVPEKHAVHWMSPNDAGDALVSKLSKTDKRSHPNGAMAAFVSGRIAFLNSNTPLAILQAFMSIAGNDDAVAEAAR